MASSNFISSFSLSLYRLILTTRGKLKQDNEWAMTSLPLYSPVTISPVSNNRPARSGLAVNPSNRPIFSVNKKLLGSGVGPKTDRKSDDLTGLDGSHRMKVEEYAEDEDEYYDDFEVVEDKGKRRSDGYDEGEHNIFFDFILLQLMLNLFFELWGERK